MCGRGGTVTFYLYLFKEVPIAFQCYSLPVKIHTNKLINISLQIFYIDYNTIFLNIRFSDYHLKFNKSKYNTFFKIFIFITLLISAF